VTFAIRTITRSATGENIVHRPQIVEADEVVVGRGADCDVRLADLAVSLRHARIRRTGPGRVLVESLGSEPFEVGTKFTSRAELNLADKPVLVFGSHVLTLSLSDEDGSVLVDVTRRDTGPETASAVNEDKIFSLAGASRFGKRPAAWALAALALVAFLAWPIATYLAKANRHIHADQPWSTGPLSKAHAFLGRNCQACHVKAFVSVRDDACLACHQASRNPETARRVAANALAWGGPTRVTLVHDHAAHDLLRDAAPPPRDLNGKVQAAFRMGFNHPNDRCASCHLEHLADAPLKQTSALGTPGAPVMQSAVGPPSHPRPTPVLRMVNGCADCHDKLRERLGTTTLRDTPDWTHHPEFRPLIARSPIGGMTPVLDRISLVEKPSDYTGLIFSHQTHLSPTGGVARMAAGLHFAGGGLGCADCHRPGPGGKGFLPVEMTRDCASCHSLAFAPGPGGAPRLLPHGHPDRVIATLEQYYGGGGGRPVATEASMGFFDSVGKLFSGGGQRPAPAAAAKIRALFAPRGLCSECHVAIAPADPASLEYRIRPIHLTERYLPWGDFDHSLPAHKEDAAGRPTCDTCHRVVDSTGSSQVMLPRIEQCAACHGKTKAQTTQAASGDCAECHSYHAPGMATPKGDHTLASSGSERRAY
jgi:hypothetical protein